MRLLVFLLLTVISVAAVAAPSPGQLTRLSGHDYQTAMQGIADSMLPRFDNMPRVRFVLARDARFQNREGKLNVLAFYTRDAKGKPVIYVNPDYADNASYRGMVDTVMHELIHAWVDWRNLRDETADGHGTPFIRKALELGVSLDYTLAAFPESRRIYEKLKGQPYTGTVDASGGGTVAGAGYLDAGIYNFRFTTFDADGRRVPVDPEGSLARSARAPKVGWEYAWNGRQWVVYAVTPEAVWLSPQVPGVLKGEREHKDGWTFRVPVDHAWHALTLPERTGKVRVRIREGFWANLFGGKKRIRFRESRSAFTLGDGQSIEFEHDATRPVEVKAVDGGEVLRLSVEYVP